MFSNVSKTLKMVRTDMWFDGSNESFNTEVAPNNILVQEMLISRHLAHEGGKVVSLTHRPPLPPGNISGTHFC